MDGRRFVIMGVPSALDVPIPTYPVPRSPTPSPRPVIETESLSPPSDVITTRAQAIESTHPFIPPFFPQIYHKTMSALRILVPVKRVIDYAVCLFHPILFTSYLVQWQQEHTAPAQTIRYGVPATTINTWYAVVPT